MNHYYDELIERLENTTLKELIIEYLTSHFEINFKR